MSKRLYVGNLSNNTTEEGLMQAFAAWEPTRVTLPTHKWGRPRGFGFVEIADDDQARQAIATMNGEKLDGLDLTVNEARPRREVVGSRGGAW